jgi:hypothetical protein
VSVVVVVVELVVGGTDTTGAGSTTVAGAGCVVSTVLWYEQPSAIPQAITAAGIIIRLLRDFISCVPPFAMQEVDEQEAGQKFRAI